MTTDPAPTHVVADVGDKRALCGIKKPRPVVLAAFVRAHVDGHGLVVCERCADRLEATR